jgi:hypothetical protein
VLKVEDRDTPCILQCILKDIWKRETCLDTRKTGTFITLPEKEDIGGPPPPGGASPSSLSPAKLSAASYSSRGHHLNTREADFREGRSSIYIFTLQQTLKQSREWNSLFNLVFVCFEKAFDSIICRLWITGLRTICWYFYGH